MDMRVPISEPRPRCSFCDSPDDSPDARVFVTTLGSSAAICGTCVGLMGTPLASTGAAPAGGGRVYITRIRRPGGSPVLYAALWSDYGDDWLEVGPDFDDVTAAIAWGRRRSRIVLVRLSCGPGDNRVFSAGHDQAFNGDGTPVPTWDEVEAAKEDDLS